MQHLQNSEQNPLVGAGWNRPVVLFAGSNYRPNYEVVDEISRTWAQKHPGVVFVVLGMRMDRCLMDRGVPTVENVVFTGLVSEEEKRVLYDLADVAIAPVKTGTGSSLKVPEAIARGKVVVGTRVGVRGFEEWTKWDSVCMSERGEETLEEVLARLVREPRAYDEACRGAAEELQQRYTWEALMEKWWGQWGGAVWDGHPRTGGNGDEALGGVLGWQVGKENKRDEHLSVSKFSLLGMRAGGKDHSRGGAASRRSHPESMRAGDTVQARALGTRAGRVSVEYRPEGENAQKTTRQ